MREEALKWWKDLSTKKKCEYTVLYYNGRLASSLTGREVETIFNEVKNLK